MTADAEPPCGHAGCRREADYRVERPDDPPAARCRWHAEGLWRTPGARVVPLHPDAPPIDTTPKGRRNLVPLIAFVAFAVVVAVGFAVIAPLM